MAAVHTPCIAKVHQVALNANKATKRWIPLDLVQNTAEYLERVPSFLSFRGVSTGWQGAVSDAVGFLNGRRWTGLKLKRQCGEDGPLWASLKVDSVTTVARCALLCLAHRLETLEWRYVNDLDFVSRLLGENNTVLTTLHLYTTDSSKRRADASCLRSCCALKKLVLSRTSVTDAGIRGLELIPVLEELNLHRCYQITDVSFLRNCRALKKLDLSYTAVTDAGILGLEFIPTLEEFSLYGCEKISDVGFLRNCRALKKLDLTDTRVEDAGILGLELIPTLEDLKLSDCSRITDVSFLRNCPALKKLHLTYTSVNDAGIHGVELIPTLEDLDLTGCKGYDGLALDYDGLAGSRPECAAKPSASATCCTVRHENHYRTSSLLRHCDRLRHGIPMRQRLAASRVRGRRKRITFPAHCVANMSLHAFARTQCSLVTINGEKSYCSQYVSLNKIGQ
jgi:hypothetical protein